MITLSFCEATSSQTLNIYNVMQIDAVIDWFSIVLDISDTSVSILIIKEEKWYHNLQKYVIRHQMFRFTTWYLDRYVTLDRGHIYTK